MWTPRPLCKFQTRASAMWCRGTRLAGRRSNRNGHGEVAAPRFIHPSVARIAAHRQLLDLLFGFRLLLLAASIYQGVATRRFSKDPHPVTLDDLKPVSRHLRGARIQHKLGLPSQSYVGCLDT